MDHQLDAPAGGLPAPGAKRVWPQVESLLRVSMETASVLLLAVEIILLLTAVVARYAFHHPITWADELASVLFLWLSVVGAAVALQRGEHMRLSALAQRLSPRWQRRLEALSVVVIVLFLAVLAGPAYEHTADEAIVQLPGMGISAAWRSAAMPAGCALMLATMLCRLMTTFDAKDFAVAAGGVAAITVALFLLKPVLLAMGNYNLLVLFGGLVSLAVAAGVPIAFAFGISTVAYLVIGTHAPLEVVASRMEEGMSHLVLLSVPLFVLLGVLIELTGMARAMIGVLVALLGHVRGGLQYVLLGAMYLVSGISGSKAADMAAIAPVLFPEMKKRGSPPGDLISLLASSAAMSETIPPSLVLITIGSVTGVSIAALFTGGLVPAMVLALALAAVAYWRARREDVSGIRRASWSEVGRALLIATPALALPFVIRAAVVGGVATATEVSTIGIAYAVLCGVFVYRQFDVSRLWRIAVETASLSGAIILIIGAASAMAWGLTQSGFSRDLAAAMAAVPGGKWGFLAISLVGFVVLGSVLEGIPAIVLFGPLLFPVARAAGIHEVHYAMVVVLAMGIGLFAPPVGVGYYTACAIGKVPPDEAMRAIWPYMGALLAALVLVAAVPWLSTGFL